MSNQEIEIKIVMFVGGNRLDEHGRLHDCVYYATASDAVKYHPYVTTTLGWSGPNGKTDPLGKPYEQYK